MREGPSILVRRLTNAWLNSCRVRKYYHCCGLAYCLRHSKVFFSSLKTDQFNVIAVDMFLKVQLSWNVIIPPETPDATIIIRLLDDISLRKAMRDLGYILAVTTMDSIGKGKGGLLGCLYISHLQVLQGRNPRGSGSGY
ncbi:hypothetical protein RJ641_020519 [Dillenia turbinata]|uniref:Uncharacterized protein n=1 Tax=Dillenia turbinata TaxID=194707 RepID=A0AAN8UTW4_9MAGN